MRLLPAFGSVLLFAACGGSSTPPNQTHPDAAVTHPGVDAPPMQMGLTGLGQKCGTGQPSCPTTAPTCLTAGGATTGFCSAVCHAGATIATDANGQFGNPSTTAADDTKCAGLFSGTGGGVPACDVPVNVTPAVANPPQKSTTFTYDAYCGIDCTMTTNACPSGTTCNTTEGSCEPN